MSHFVLDGYNVIRSQEWLSLGSLRDQRERLLRLVEEKAPQGRSAQVTVVCDGRADVSSPRWGGTTTVLFSAGKDADSVIKNKVDQMQNPSQITVVTNDRAIQRWVRGVGAQVMSCEEFLSRTEGPPPKRGPTALTSDEAEDINEELRDLWKLK